MATKLDLQKYQTNYNKRPYWLSILIATDQLLNTVFKGYPDETISSRAYRCRSERRWAIAERVIDTLFFFDHSGDIKHCQLAYLGELAQEHFPPEFRD